MNLQEFRMPRYREIPNVGLFLEQTVKYINTALEPLGCIEITPSMVSNYVKKRYIKGPVKKQYDAVSIAQLIFAAVAKSVISMDNIRTMLDMQGTRYPIDMAYNRFCDLFESTLISGDAGFAGNAEVIPDAGFAGNAEVTPDAGFAGNAEVTPDAGSAEAHTSNAELAGNVEIASKGDAAKNNLDTMLNHVVIAAVQIIRLHDYFEQL